MEKEKFKKESITLAELISQVAEETENEIREVRYVLDVFIDLCREGIVNKKKIIITNLMTMEMVECKSKTGKNNYGQEVVRPAFKKLKVKAGAGLRRLWGEDISRNRSKKEEGSDTDTE